MQHFLKTTKNKILDAKNNLLIQKAVGSAMPDVPVDRGCNESIG
jgi:hypothetical protein